MKYYHTPNTMAKMNGPCLTNRGQQDVKKLEIQYTPGGNVKRHDHLEHNLVSSSKVKCGSSSSLAV